MDTTNETPLYATQGGGYAILKDGVYVWHSEIPSFLPDEIGDPIPDEWSVVSVNDAARQEQETVDTH